MADNPKIDERDADAYVAGVLAFRDDLGRNRNPHADATSLAAREWDRGWCSARDQT